MRGKAERDGRPAVELILLIQLWTKVHVHHSKLKPTQAPPQYVCNQVH